MGHIQISKASQAIMQSLAVLQFNKNHLQSKDASCKPECASYKLPAMQKRVSSLNQAAYKVKPNLFSPKL